MDIPQQVDIWTDCVATWNVTASPATTDHGQCGPTLGVCDRPTTDPEVLASQLRRVTPLLAP